MGSTGFIKRILPFLATFAVGIFIASFFVSVAPSFGSNWKGRKAECRRMRLENERLRNENLRLRNQLEREGTTLTEIPRIAHDDLKARGPEFPVEAPPPPPPPRRAR